MAQPKDPLWADSYLFCAPENLATIAGVKSDFFERCYYPLPGKFEGWLHAQMVCAGADAENAARETAQIAKGLWFKGVQSPLIICTHALTPVEIPGVDLRRCRKLGAGLAIVLF